MAECFPISHLVNHLHVHLEAGDKAPHALEAGLGDLGGGALEGLVEDGEDLVPALGHVVAGRNGPQGGLPERHQVRHVLVARQLLQVGVVLLAEGQQLGEEDLVLGKY